MKQIKKLVPQAFKSEPVPLKKEPEALFVMLLDVATLDLLAHYNETKSDIVQVIVLNRKKKPAVIVDLNKKDDRIIRFDLNQKGETISAEVSNYKGVLLYEVGLDKDGLFNGTKRAHIRGFEIPEISKWKHGKRIQPN